MTEHILERNKKKTTQLILLDFNKAFNFIWHNGLIIKLHAIKIPSSLINIIISYLHNRNFYVSINGTKFTTKKVVQLEFLEDPF